MDRHEFCQAVGHSAEEKGYPPGSGYEIAMNMNDTIGIALARTGWEWDTLYEYTVQLAKRVEELPGLNWGYMEVQRPGVEIQAAIIAQLTDEEVPQDDPEAAQAWFFGETLIEALARNQGLQYGE